MNTLIIGNSQSEGAGSVLKNIFKLKGDSVTHLSKHGANTNGIIELFDSKVKQPFNFDRVVVFNWDTNNINKLLSRFVNHDGSIPEIIWYGSPPATEIVDVPYSQKVFGKKVTDHDYWFSSGYANEREGFNIKLKQLLPSNVKYIDYRDLSLSNMIQQKSGVSFPDLKDGIHITTAVAKEMFAEPNWPSVASADVSKAQTQAWLRPVLVASGAVVGLAGLWWLLRHVHRQHAQMQ